MADNVIVRVPEQQFIKGEDGYSPEVTIEDIAHGHRITITDKEHPEGQTADVMDGDSAYEQAVAGGYTGTEAQFNEELASFNELSEQAADSAAAAAQSESNAAGSATTATTKAQEAADSAAQALIRMNSAATSAQTAADASSFFTSTILPNAVATINNTRDQAVANVNVAKHTAVQDVSDEGTTQISAVQTASATQQAAIQQKGEDALAALQEYADLPEDVDNLKSAANNQEKTYSKGWTRGSYLTTTGAVNNTPIAQNNIRYYSYFGIINGVTRLYCDAGYEFCLFAYTKKGNFIGALREDDTFKIGYVAEAGPLKYITDFLTNAYPEYTFRISLRKNPVSTPDLSEGVNFHCDMLDFGNFQWTGKIAYFYGTSLTAREVNYWSAMRIRMGLSAINKGISGQGIGNFGALSTGGVFNAICNTTDGKTNADLIILETGANDVNENVPLGTIFDDTQSTLAGCLNLCLRYLQANTTAQIVVMPSPAYASAPSASDQKWVWKEMIKDICYINCVHFAEPDNNIGYGRLSGPDSSDYIVDSIHQTEKGAYLTGLSMEKHLKNVPLFEFPEN